jgi:hypothetical protein
MQIDGWTRIDDAHPSTVVRVGSCKREEVAAYDSKYHKLSQSFDAPDRVYEKIRLSSSSVRATGEHEPIAISGEVV